MFIFQDIKFNGKKINIIIQAWWIAEAGSNIFRMGSQPEKNRGVSEGAYPIQWARNRELTKFSI